MTWIFHIFFDGFKSILYFIFVYLPLQFLNLLYNVFKIVGGGFLNRLFNVQISDSGKVTWNFNWGGQIATIVICLIIVSVFIWLFYLIIKIHHQNAARRFGNGGQVKEHVKYLVGFPLFLLASPFIMMIFSTLLSLLIGIFNKNVPATLSPNDIFGLKTYMSHDINQFSNIGGTPIMWDGNIHTFQESLLTLKIDLESALNAANSGAKSTLADNIQAELKIVNELYDYVNSGLGKDLGDLNNLINQLQAGKLDFKQANQLANIMMNLNHMSDLIGKMNDSFKSISGYKDWLLQQVPTLKMFDIVPAIQSSFTTTSANAGDFNNLGDYLSDRGLLSQLMMGNAGFDNLKYIGLYTLEGRLTGSVDFNLVQLIFELITGKNGVEWSAVKFDWDGISLINLVGGSLICIMTCTIMFGAVWTVCKLWAHIFFSWFQCVPTIAKGEDDKMKAHATTMFSYWLQLFLVYLLFELATVIIPTIGEAFPKDANGMRSVYDNITVLMFTDGVMAVSLIYAKKIANSFGEGEVEYYSQGRPEHLNQAKDTITDAGDSAYKGGKRVGKWINKKYLPKVAGAGGGD